MKTVLVAEDEPAILEMIAAVLADEGYRVLVARDGVEAVELLAREAPDLVLTDAMMPRLDGLGLVGRMRADPRTAAIPVVVASAVLRGEPDGFDGVAFLPKPFDLDRLLAVVAEHVGG